MKIKLNKEVITLAEIEQAKEFAEENSWIDKETVIMGATYNVKAYHETESIFDLELIGTPELTVEKNHYQMVIWCKCFVKYQGILSSQCAADLINALVAVPLVFFTQRK